MRPLLDEYLKERRSRLDERGDEVIGFIDRGQIERTLNWKGEEKKCHYQEEVLVLNEFLVTLFPSPSRDSAQAPLRDLRRASC